MSLDIRTAAAKIKQTRFSFVLFAQVTRIAFQALLFTFLARGLGIYEFGIFSAYTAIALILAPFVNLGNGAITVREVARDKSMAKTLWRNLLTVTLLGGIVIATLATTVAMPILHNDAALFAFFILMLTELLFAKVIEISGLICQAVGDVRPFAFLPSLLSMIRLSLLFIYIHVADDQISLVTWTVVSLSATGIVAIFAVMHAEQKIRPYGPSKPLTISERTRGIVFAFGLTTQNAYQEGDKSLLVPLSSAIQAGAYSASSKIIEMMYAPIRAIATVLYPRYFSTGALGLKHALKLSSKVALPVMSYGVVSTTMLYCTAHFIPDILGAEYEAAIPIVRVLSFTLLIRCASFLFADALTGADHHAERVRTQIIVTVANILLNVIFIPIYGAIASAIIMVFCEAAILTTLAFVCYRKLKPLNKEKAKNGK